MSDLLRVRAVGDNGSLAWEFIDPAMAGCEIQLDQPPVCKINSGDIWQVELVNSKTSGKGLKQKRQCTVRLIALLQQIKQWQQVKELQDFWMPETTLQQILIMLYSGIDIILIGDKGTGKTDFPWKLCKTIGWQEPLKVDVYVIQKTTDLFGANRADKGSTYFVRSALFDYIERASIAHKKGLDTQFIVELDEINRVHSKANESMHGLFDHTRQVTILTTEGSKTIKLTPNIHFIGTMNMGSEYSGTYPLDIALKDRFFPVKMQPMPLDYEVRRLVTDTNITEAQATAIVKVGKSIREIAKAKGYDYSPSYRPSVNVGHLVAHGVNLPEAIIAGFMGWYQGELVLDAKGDPLDPKSEVAIIYSALRQVGVALGKTGLKAKELVA